MNLRFLPAAREEPNLAVLYLEGRLPGLGEELVDDVERTSSLLIEFARMGRPLDSLHRVIPLQRFSFDLVCRIGLAEIIIVAIVHQRRRPGYWRG